MNNIAKKLFAVGLAASTALMGMAPLAAQAAAHAGGTNVVASDGTVYMITTDGMRRPYTSAGAFLSYGFNSFASTVEANGDDMALPVGSFIPPQDGKVICSDRDDSYAVKGTCYVISNGQRLAFTSASVFTGRGFSFSRAEDADVSWMPVGPMINDTTSVNPVGVLVNNGGTVQLRGEGVNLGIPDLATFNSWGYSFADVVPANSADSALTQSGVMVGRQPGQLSPSFTTGGGGPVVSGNVSASLAFDNPAAQTVAVLGTPFGAASSTIVTLANFSFTGNGTITQFQLKRFGVSPDTIFNNVYLYSGGTRLTDAASVGGSSLVTFNNPSGLFTVNGSMTVSVVAEIAGNSSAGQTVGAQLTSYTVANGSPASVSISGNLFTIAVAADLAYAQFGGVTPGSASGESRNAAADTEIFRSQVTINQRDMTMSRFIVRNIGSAQQADLNNFRLRIDGSEVAVTQAMDANGYVYFSFSPVTLKAGTRTFSVLADIVGGTSRTFQFQVRNRADVNFTDTQYNTSVSAANTFPFGSSNAVTISVGNLVIQRATDSPSGNVTDGSSNVSFAKYTATAYGEAQKIENLLVGYTPGVANIGSLRNGRILINGVQYGSTATLASTTAGGTQYTLNYTVQPGTTITIEIRADMFDNDAQGNSLVNGSTVTAAILGGTTNVQRLVSLGYDSVPSIAISGNAISNVTGSVTFSKNNTYSTQTAPLPQTNYKIASFNLVGSSAEDVNINSIMVGSNGATASTTMTALYNVKVLVNGTLFGSQVGSVGITGTTTVATSTFSGNYNLPKNTTVAVEVFADMAAPSGSYAADSISTTAIITGTAVDSSTSINSGAVGQTVNFGASTITAAQDPSTPVAAITAGNQTKTAAAFKWTTTNDQFTISEVVVSIATNTTVSNVMLKDGSTVLATQPGQASTTFSNLSVVVPANSTKILTVELQLGEVGYGAGTSGDNAKVNLHSYKSAPSSSGAISGTTSGTSVAGNALFVYKAIPTITNVTLPTSVLQPGGTNTLAKFTISSGGTGTIGWTKLQFTYSTSSGVSNLSATTLWDADTNTQIAASTSVDHANKTIYFGTTAEQQISGAKTYVLKATVTGGSTSGDYVATSLAQPSGFATPATAVVATATTASFVWSDLSAQSHGLGTSDWNNGYLVKNLPTDSQTLVK